MSHKAQQAQPHHPTTVPAGSTISIPTIVQPAAPAVNPLMSGENWMPLLSLLAGLALMIGFATKFVASKLADFKESHGHVHALIDRRLDEVEHDGKNLRARQDSVEHLRGKDEARFVKLEGEISAFKDAVVRIERNQEKFAEEEKAGRKEIIESLRELREVKPR